MTRENIINIYITDDHPMVISGLKNILGIAPHIHVMATFTSGKDLIKGLQKNTPDVLLLDVMLGDTTADTLVPEILALSPALKILIVSSVDNIQVVKQLTKNGVLGYVLKTVSPQQLIEAIETVYHNKPYISSEIKEEMVQSMLTNKKDLPVKGLMLTRREMDVLREIANGLSGKEMSEKLNISINTLETHKRNLFLKLDVKNSISLVKKAYALNLL